MIVELLKPEKIVLGLRGEFRAALEDLLRLADTPGLSERTREALFTGKAERYNYIGDHIAIPHIRVENLAVPEMILGLSTQGLNLNGKVVHVVLFFAMPAAQTEEHLQLLQRLSSLLPAISDDLLAQRDARAALRAIARGERLSGKATYFNLTEEQVAFELQTDLERGLTNEEAKRRLLHYGPNVLRRTRKTPWTVKLAGNLFSFFAILLWIAALLCFVPGVDMPQLGWAIAIVILVNGVFAFLQEERSDRAVEMLQTLISPKCRVVREGQTLAIHTSRLAPGDLVLLQAGDLVPADARLIEAHEVEVDNSALTGESAPARRYKSEQTILIPGEFLWMELPNIVFAGTTVLRGDARAVVFGTGMRSEIGKIAVATQAIRAEQSPLQKELHSTVAAIGFLAGGLGLGFLFLGWIVGGLSFIEAFVFFIGLFVANVPEGLLPTVTLSLAMGVTRMAKRNALVKNLTSVETLGCTTVICSDKTGTLTQNLMMVTQVYVDGEFVQVTGSGYRPRGEFFQDGRRLPLEEISRRPAFRHLLECALVCNNARIEETASGYRVLGDPTEGALIALAEKAGMRGIHQRLHLNPFESIRKKMSVVVRLEGRGETTAYLKGAPLETLAVCDRVLSRGEVRPLDQASRDEIIAANDALASRGLRVLALASRDDPFLQEGSGYGIAEVERQLIFLGLAAISDPVRPEVPEAVRACHAAGIRVIMITGDYALTAAAIGREIGLGNGLSLDVFSGAQVSAMADDRLRSILAQGETIFARVAPEHKLRIVSLLKEMGEVVAVTGDGVNDAPALKKADIGIAMGVRGNDVAKEAAHMILTDDNFSSIVAAIEEGRAIFENIRRFMAYIFNSNPQEMIPYLIWILFPGMPLAMTVMGVLAVDVGTDLIPAMGLGIEPPEKGIMERPPRRRNERLLSLRFILRSYFVQGSLLAFSSYATYYYMGWVLGYWRPGLSLSSMPASPPGLRLDEATGPYLQTLTAYFFPTVTTQIANVLSKRSWKASLFSPDFLNPAYRRNLLNAIAASSPGRAIRAAPDHSPVAERLAGFLERHYILLNFVSNPLINLGILFELFLCYLFFYSPLAKIYYFAPVPWHVYLFAFHGTALLLAFEEIKKYYRRKGHPLEFLG